MAEREIPIASLRVPQLDNRLRLRRKYSLRIRTREQWLKGELQLPENSQVWYTDGSKMARSGSSGAVVYREDQGVRRSFSAGNLRHGFSSGGVCHINGSTKRGCKDKYRAEHRYLLGQPGSAEAEGGLREQNQGKPGE